MFKMKIIFNQRKIITLTMVSVMLCVEKKKLYQLLQHINTLN